MEALSYSLGFLERISTLPKLLGARSTVVLLPPYAFVVPVGEVREARRSLEHIFVYRDYERFAEFSPETASRIVDLGAYLGFFTVRSLLLSRGSRAVAVEANPLSCMYAHWNIALHGLSGRARVVCSAVDGERGLSKLYVGESMVNSSLLRGYVEEYTSVIGERWVPKITLEDVFRLSGFERIDLLKVDVEGVEYRVLSASKAALEHYDVQRIVVEVHEGFSTAKKLSEALGAEYATYIVVDEGAPNQSFLFAVRKR